MAQNVINDQGKTKERERVNERGQDYLCTSHEYWYQKNAEDGSQINLINGRKHSGHSVLSSSKRYIEEGIPNSSADKFHCYRLHLDPLAISQMPKHSEPQLSKIRMGCSPKYEIIFNYAKSFLNDPKTLRSINFFDNNMQLDRQHFIDLVNIRSVKEYLT